MTRSFAATSDVASTLEADFGSGPHFARALLNLVDGDPPAGYRRLAERRAVAPSVSEYHPGQDLDLVHRCGWRSRGAAGEDGRYVGDGSAAGEQ